MRSFERLHVSRLLSAGLLGGALAAVFIASAAYAAATAETILFTVPIASTSFVACANNRAGETVFTDGTASFVLHTTFADQGNLAGVDRSNVRLTAVGGTTGDTWVGGGASKTSIVGTVNGASMLSSSATSRLSGQGQTPDLFFRLRSLLTINANGEVTANFFEFEIGCG